MKVTAIIPAYNAAPWIGDAIRSIQGQTVPVHELVVVDDCSSDETAAIACSLGAEVLALAVNGGEGVARNAGLARATGDMIAWLDADDLWAPHHLQVLGSLFDRHPQASVACAAVERFGLRSGINNGYAPVDAPANIFWTAARDWLHPIIGAMMRADALREIGGFATNCRASVDYDMWLRLSRNHSFIATREVTSFWRWHAAQQSSDYGSQLAAVYAFRRQYLDGELTGKHPADAERFAEIMRGTWNADVALAVKNDDPSLCARLLEVHDLIPGLDEAAVIRACDALARLREGADAAAP